MINLILLLAATTAMADIRDGNRYSDNPFNTKKALSGWWEQSRRAQAELNKKLPREVRASFDKAAAGFQPVAALSALAEGDFNCDGKADYALVSVPSESKLARALAAKKIPSDNKLKAAHADYLDFRYSDPATIWVALSGHARSWISLAGSAVETAGKVSLTGELGCAKLVPGQQVMWARENKCEGLKVGGREYYLWDPEKKDLRSVGQCVGKGP